MTGKLANAVLLSAGRGSRLHPLTEATHKSLLPIAGRPVLAYTIDQLLAHDVSDIVIVTGDKHDSVERFACDNYPGRVRCIYNPDYAVDTNILSTELGVGALRDPSLGYMIIETDLVMESAAWQRVLDIGTGRESFWATRDVYSQRLLGGVLAANAQGSVTAIAYVPQYLPEYEGWQKLLGVLYVGGDQVATDRTLRQRAIARTVAQYYMMPWVENLSQLACRARPLGELYAASFNDLHSYRATAARFAEIVGSQEEVA